MASVHREVVIQAEPAAVWDALRDVGAVHTRLAPGFVTDVRLEGEARVVTFGNGFVARELLVDVDEQSRRVAWAAVGEPFTHYNASPQVFPDGPGRTRFVWIADLLPHDMAPTVTGLIEQGLEAIQRTLER
ncbi:MAG: SRPBCC family protein [Gemmatimonadales bacterium]